MPPGNTLKLKDKFGNKWAAAVGYAFWAWSAVLVCMTKRGPRSCGPLTMTPDVAPNRPSSGLGSATTSNGYYSPMRGAS